MVIISGIPRCGTTLLARTIAGLPTGNTWPGNTDKVIKQHYPNVVYPYRAVFLFGDIVKSIISMVLNRWDKNSFKNCGCKKSMGEINIFAQDDLNYEYIFDYWTSTHPCSVLAIRYEKMWNHINEIEKFTQRRIKLPPRKERKTALSMISKAELDSIHKTYDSLILKVKKMPNIKLIGGEWQ